MAALLTAGFFLAPDARASEISICSAGAVKAALSELATKFEHDSGHHVAIEYAPVGTLMRRLAEGNLPDIVILSADVMPEAVSKNWATQETVIALGKSVIGVAMRQGAVLPDISTPEALRQVLLDAKSITYIDPAKGTSGKHFAQVLQRLGIADSVKSKTTLGDAGYVVEPVARGEIELGVQQITEILPVKGVTLVGPLPDSLQKITVYSAASTPAARDPTAVRSFLHYLRGDESRELFLRTGFMAP
jgi:molybdate transport system substrate-binding protein